MSKHDSAIIGVSDHAGWAILVTASANGTLLDRRRVALMDEDLPPMPHHCEGQLLPLEDAVALVERVRVAAERHSQLALDALATTVPGPILGVALRHCPDNLPPTIAGRLQDYRARNVADWVMYRRALAGAAKARGWAVHWYDARNVLQAAGEALRLGDVSAHFSRLRRSIGPPWANDHKVAMAAAVVAATARGRVQSLPEASSAAR